MPYLGMSQTTAVPFVEAGANRFDPFVPEEELFFLGKATPLDNVRNVTVKDCFINPREMVSPTRTQKGGVLAADPPCVSGACCLPLWCSSWVLQEVGVWPPDYVASDHGFLTVQYELQPSL